MSDRFALIYNPRSRRNLKADPRYLELAGKMLGPLFCSPRTHAALRQQVYALLQQKISCLVVDGGDGTVGNVLSALYTSSCPPEQWPSIVVLPSGNTNLIATDVGFGKRGVEALQILQARLASGRLLSDVRRRQPLVVTRDGQKKEASLGFFGGLGAFGRGIEIAHDPKILKNYSHDAAVMATLFVTAWQLLSPKHRRGWLEGTKVTVERDGEILPEQNHFLFLCTALHRLPHGIWPFWQNLKEADRGISYLDVAAFPPHLGSAVWNLLRGKAPQWLRQDAAYHSGSATELVLRTDQSFILDGEVLSPGQDGSLTISAGPVVSFVHV